MNDNEEEIVDKYSDEDDEYEEMLMSYEEDDESIIPELYFCNPDPYLKPEPLPDDHYRPEIHFDEEGRIYIYYTIQEIMEMLGCGNQKAVSLLYPVLFGSSFNAS